MLLYAICRVTAGGGGRDTGGILLRAHDSTDRHRLGGDGRTRGCTVLHSFRASTIHRPLRGSQATFVDKNRFRLQRARKLRDEPFLYTDERLAGGIVVRGCGHAVYAIGKSLLYRIMGQAYYPSREMLLHGRGHLPLIYNYFTFSKPLFFMVSSRDFRKERYASSCNFINSGLLFVLTTRKGPSPLILRAESSSEYFIRRRR